MGDHVNTKKDTSKHHKAGFSEGRDLRLERARRVTFKSYINDLEESLIDDDLNAEEWLVEKYVDNEWIKVEAHLTEEDAQEAADLLANASEDESFRVSQA